MMIPFEIQNPIRLATSAFAQTDEESGIDAAVVFELHAHHVVQFDSTIFAHCVIHLPHFGPAGHAAVEISEFLELPVPADLLDQPCDIAALLDESWRPRQHEPQLRFVQHRSVETKEPTSEEIDVLDEKDVQQRILVYAVELRTLTHRWQNGQPVVRTIKVLEAIQREETSDELSTLVGQLLELLVPKQKQRSFREHERCLVLHNLQRIISTLE
jgi:hypothetical protein